MNKDYKIDRLPLVLITVFDIHAVYMVYGRQVQDSSIHGQVLANESALTIFSTGLHDHSHVQTLFGKFQVHVLHKISDQWKNC